MKHQEAVAFHYLEECVFIPFSLVKVARALASGLGGLTRQHARVVDRGSDQIISHPRVIEDSARRKDSKRAKKREKRKEKKALERTQKEEELKRIKNLMKESIKKQLSKIQETSGASGTTPAAHAAHARVRG